MKLKCLKPFTHNIGRFVVIEREGSEFTIDDKIAATLIKEGYAEQIKEEVIEPKKSKSSKKVIKLDAEVTPVEDVEDSADGVSEE